MSDFGESLVLFERVTSGELYRVLIDQINKDLMFSGLSFSLAPQTQPEVLIDTLGQFIEELVKNRFSDYLNLLYRVDISEIEIKKLDGSDVQMMSKQVAVMMVKRECQKVLLKNKL